MEYRRFENIIVLRLDRGESIPEEISGIAEKEGIALANVSGIGATNDFAIGVFDPETKKYDELHFTGNHEITSLCGNINTMNGRPYTHLHISCGNAEGKLYGGHLVKAIISVTAEIIITVIDGKVDRKLDENLGFNALSFD